MEDPGADPQPRGASFHRSVTQQSRRDAGADPSCKRGRHGERQVGKTPGSPARRTLRPPGPGCSFGDPRGRAAGQGEPLRGCWAGAQVGNALSSSQKETPGVEGRHEEQQRVTGTLRRVLQAGLPPLADPQKSQRLAFGCLTGSARRAGRKARPGGQPSAGDRGGQPALRGAGLEPPGNP